jgi:periplasmic protein TonB
MKRRLFEDLVVSAAGGRRARGGLGWPVSLTLHAVGVAGLLALPALTTEALPDPPVRTVDLVPVIVPVQVPPPPSVTPPRPAGGGARRTGPVVTTRRMEAVPQRVPDLPPAPDHDEPFTPDEPDNNVGFCVGNCSSTQTGGEDTGGGGAGGSDVGPGTGPVRVTSLMKAPTKIRDVRPVYPALAQQARVQGTVVIECIISTDGRVEQVQVVSGHPLLQPAALDAVRQWRYTPTLLGGVPVSVIMTVTVNFILH